MGATGWVGCKRMAEHRKKLKIGNYEKRGIA
jgi:hypothetical protein